MLNWPVNMTYLAAQWLVERDSAGKELDDEELLRNTDRRSLTAGIWIRPTAAPTFPARGFLPWARSRGSGSGSHPTARRQTARSFIRRSWR